MPSDRARVTLGHGQKAPARARHGSAMRQLRGQCAVGLVECVCAKPWEGRALFFSHKRRFSPCIGMQMAERSPCHRRHRS